jgi:hypothetical protein
MRQTEIGVASEEALDGVVEESDEGKFIQGHTCGEWDILLLNVTSIHCFHEFF